LEEGFVFEVSEAGVDKEKELEGDSWVGAVEAGVGRGIVGDVNGIVVSRWNEGR